MVKAGADRSPMQIGGPVRWYEAELERRARAEVYLVQFHGKTIPRPASTPPPEKAPTIECEENRKRFSSAM